GALMLEPEAWDEVADLISEEDFYKPTHRKIFGAIRELNRKGQPTDLITVSNILIETKDLEAIGGPSYLAEIMDQTPSTANIVSYAKIIHEKSLLRRLIATSTAFIDQAYSQDFEDVDSFLDSVEAQIFKVAEK